MINLQFKKIEKIKMLKIKKPILNYKRNYLNKDLN